MKYPKHSGKKLDWRLPLFLEYNSLKSETQKVEQIRRIVSEIMREESRERTETRMHGVEK